MKQIFLSKLRNKHCCAVGETHKFKHQNNARSPTLAPPLGCRRAAGSVNLMGWVVRDGFLEDVGP